MMKDEFKKIRRNVYRSTNNASKFKFLVKINQVQHTKIFYAPAASKGEMIESAVEACRLYCETKREDHLWENKDTTVTVDKVWDDITKSKIRHKVWGKNYRMNVKGFYNNHIRPVLGAMAIADVKPSDITRFMNGLSKVATGTPLSKRTQKRALELITPIFSSALENGLIRENPIKPTHDRKRSRSTEKKIILAPVEEYELTNNVLHDLFDDKPKVLAAFLFGFHGRRLSETLTMKWSDVDFNSKTYKIPAANSKIDKDLVFDLNEELEVALMGIRRSRKKFIFSSESSETGHWVSISSYYKQIRVYVPGFGFHRMRNLLASTMAAQGATVPDISATLGHSSTATTEHYLTLQYTDASKKIGELSKKILKRDKKPTKYGVVFKNDS